MAKVDYDQFAGLARLAEAHATIDQRAAVILTYHAALEREMDVVLARLLSQPDRIRSFGFSNKLNVLAAAWEGTKESGDALYDVLFRFNELRNAVAHGDRSELVDESLNRLLLAYREINSDPPEGVTIEGMAAGICCFMADGPTPREISTIFKGLESLLERFGDISQIEDPSRE